MQAMWTPPWPEKDAPTTKLQRLVSLTRGMCFGEQALIALGKERMRRSKRKIAIVVTKPPLVLLVLSPRIVNELASLEWFDEWLDSFREHIGATMRPGVDAVVVHELNERDGNGIDHLEAAAAVLMSLPKKAAEAGNKGAALAKTKKCGKTTSPTKARHGDGKATRFRDDGKVPRGKDASSSSPNAGARKSMNARRGKLRLLDRQNPHGLDEVH